MFKDQVFFQDICRIFYLYSFCLEFRLNMFKNYFLYLFSLPQNYDFTLGLQPPVCRPVCLSVFGFSFSICVCLPVCRLAYLSHCIFVCFFVAVLWTKYPCFSLLHFHFFPQQPSPHTQPYFLHNIYPCFIYQEFTIFFCI